MNSLNTPFLKWLEQTGVAHCAPMLGKAGLVDFDDVVGMTENELCAVGLSPDDCWQLLRGLAARDEDGGSIDGSDPETTSAPHVFIGEIRPLTVMFCDLVGYTTLTHRLRKKPGLETLLKIRASYLEACAKVVAKYGGTIAQVQGDGVMAYFGNPAFGNDAERGVMSAIEIVQTVKTLSIGEPLAVHIGVATGPVVLVPDTGGVDTGLAVGETPNLAARFQAIAGHNEIVIGHSTRRLVGETFVLKDLGLQELRGIEGQTRVWRVDGKSRNDMRFINQKGDAPLGPLVGRTRLEHARQLEDEWQRAESSLGRIVLIRGDAGMGKSRLTEELLVRINSQPHTLLRYQCSPFHVNAALHPVTTHIELVAGFTRDDSPEQKLDKLEKILIGSPAESAPLFAAMLSLPADRYAPLGLSAQKQKERTLEVLVTQVEALSRKKPVLMVVEDVHWIDPTSQELVDALVSSIATLPIMLLLTSRVDPQHPYRPSWIDAAPVTTLTLEGLVENEVIELAHSVAEGKELPAEVLQQILTRGDGVPLFIEELTRLYLESGLLVLKGDRYELSEPLPTLDIPANLNEFLIERLDRHKRVKELAQMGACIGRVFSYELLAAVSGRSGDELQNELQSLTRTGLVLEQPVPHRSYSFKHALVRDAAYDSLLPSQQQMFHKRIADVLERTFPESAESEPEVLAHHRTQSGELLAAIPLWRQAGESALARMALREAVAYLDEGLKLLEQLSPSPDRDGLELSLREPLHSARLRWRGWAAPAVGLNARSILWLAQKQHRPQSLLVGLWGMWINTITQGRVEETKDLAQRLLDEGIQSDDADMRIFGLRALQSSHFYLGELKDSFAQREPILALYTSLYDPQRASRWMELTGNDTRTAVGVFAPQALWMLGRPDEAARLTHQNYIDARRLGHPFDIGWALTWGAYVYDYRREPDRLLEGAEIAESLGRDQGIPVLYRSLAPMVRGLGLLRKNEVREAATFLEAAIEGWRASGGYLNLPYLTAGLAEARALDGDLDAGLRLLDECVAQIERPGWSERVWLPEVLRLKGWVLMRQNKRAEAEAQLRMSLQWAQRQQARSWELRTATTLAQLLADSREEKARKAAFKQLEDVYNVFRDNGDGLNTYDLRVAASVLGQRS